MSRIKVLTIGQEFMGGIADRSGLKGGELTKVQSCG
jgi:hypothetical protein